MINAYRTPCSVPKGHLSFPSTQGTSTRRDRVQGLKSKFQQISKKVSHICMFSDHREIKLEMNKKMITGKSLSVLEIKYLKDRRGNLIRIEKYF